MAWKEYSDLSKADQQHEDTRQKMIVCQSCLDRAVSLLVPKCSKPPTVDLVKKTASELVDWVYEKANEKLQQQETNNNTFPQQHHNSGTIPEPTLAQKKVLDAICKTMTEKQYNSFDHVTDIYWCVLKWAKEVHNVDYYPENMSSVDKFIKWLNKQ